MSIYEGRWIGHHVRVLQKVVSTVESCKVVIPIDLLRKLGLHAGDFVKFKLLGDSITIQKATPDEIKSNSK